VDNGIPIGWKHVLLLDDTRSLDEAFASAWLGARGRNASVLEGHSLQQGV